MNSNKPALFISVCCALFVWIFFLFAGISQSKAQTPGLSNLVDYSNNWDIQEQATHTFIFTLPLDAPQVNPTDYIRFRFDNYTDVTAPTYVQGTYAGTPDFSTDNTHNAYVTGITVTPGTQLTIGGMTAVNPIVMLNLYTTVYISEDFATTIIKNSGTTAPILLPNTIAMNMVVGLPYANLQISGYAAPYTYVLFNEGLSTLGTGYTSLTGYFSRYFSGIPGGTHYLSFYGIDQANRNTSTISVVLDTPIYQLTTLTDQLLSPTIAVDDVAIDPGEPIYATGSAAPDTTINLFTDSPLRSYATTADVDGNWTVTITDSSGYVPGDYRLYAMAQTGTGLQSLFSPAVLFTLTPTSVGSGTACGDISEGDLNCDTLVNLADFSILMYYWGTISPAADINLDGAVNLTDFSVMMYYWGS